MSKSKMQTAKQLIQDHKYDQARTILATVDHPTAREWEAKLNRIAPVSAKKRTPWWKLVVLGAGLLILAGVVVFTIIDNQRIARNIQAIKDEHASQSLQADREYCLTLYNDNPAAYDRCMERLGH